MKIVINNQYGGFGLSLLAIREYLILKGKKDIHFYETKIEDDKVIFNKIENIQENESIFTYCFLKDFGKSIEGEKISDEDFKKYSFNIRNIERTDKDLIVVIEKLKEKVNTSCSTLKIIEMSGYRKNIEHGNKKRGGKQMKTLLLILIAVLIYIAKSLIEYSKELERLEKDYKKLYKENEKTIKNCEKYYNKYIDLEEKCDELEKESREYQDIIKNHSEELQNCSKSTKKIYKFKLIEEIKALDIKKECKEKVLEKINKEG